MRYNVQKLFLPPKDPTLAQSFLSREQSDLSKIRKLSRYFVTKIVLLFFELSNKQIPPHINGVQQQN